MNPSFEYLQRRLEPKYNLPGATGRNTELTLWQLVRASTAAPTYFPPEVIHIPAAASAKAKDFVFVDGGVTMFNNPAFQLFPHGHERAVSRLLEDRRGENANCIDRYRSERQCQLRPQSGRR